jgi:prolyl oligopeptidase
MRTLLHSLALAGLVSGAGTRALSTAAAAADPAPGAPPPGPARPPETRAEPIADTLFGVAVPDPYRWLEDARSPEVRAWMAAQDGFARRELKKLPRRDALRRRFHQLYYLDSISAPKHRGTRYFYTRTHTDREKAIVYWKEREDGEEQVLLDPHVLSPDSTTALGVWVPTYDGTLVAYALRANNADEATLYVMDVATGRTSDIDVIEGARYAEPSWTPAGDGFYYTYLPTDPAIPVADRPGYAEVRYHRLGSDPRTDPVIHERTGDPETFIGADLSRDGHWLFLAIQHGWNSTDVYYRDARSPDRNWKPFAVGRNAIYQVTAWKDRFYVLTNDGAPRWRVLRADPAHPEPEHWQEIVPEAADAVIENAQIVGQHLVLAYLRDASNQLEIRTLDGARVRSIPLPGIGASGGMAGNPDEDDAYFGFDSFTRPPEIHRTSIRSGETTLWAAVEIPIDPAPYVVEQVRYPSRDGVSISMFLVHRRDMSRDGSTPFLLTGYGGFNVSLLPWFSSSIYPWLEAGGGYAVPNLRGGGEYGEEWHKAGMLHQKQNVFDDFIAAAEYLIESGCTRPERLAISGGSNGGLLVGAAMTQRPDLFRAVVCGAPLLDMVRYHLFGSGKTWIPEYGSAEDEAEFKTLHAYSPYHRVRPGTAYPALLMESPDDDDRVDPMHARKMAAAVQAATASGHPVILRIEQNAGHGGADLVRQRVEISADTYAFLMHELGMDGAAAGGP